MYISIYLSISLSLSLSLYIYIYIYTYMYMYTRWPGAGMNDLQVSLPGSNHAVVAQSRTNEQSPVSLHIQ